ncbi:hypothetical protein NLI96_g9779 [Meripilus lineatus]|uniref:Extracellular membrane protein CFEM domain-containing protein n=1 Tax=Meripilus lineatus TaxID=2056292 RepID=A0AAD5YCL6_9APHY|nr:hypothetical protein NLI96_g9779 [Physisporinus lineatus]
MLAFALFSAALLATSASAFDIGDAKSGIASALHHRSIYARQINPSDVPAECQSQCAATVDVLNSNTCVTASCLCTTTINQGFASCLSCVAAGDPTLVAQAQQAIASYEDACASAGIPVASLTISGGAASTRAPVSSAVIPTGGASQASSVFFSSSGAAGTGAPVATPTRSVITPSTSGSAAAAASTTPAGPVPNGAQSLVGMQGMAVGGLVAVAGAMFAL